MPASRGHDTGNFVEPHYTTEPHVVFYVSHCSLNKLTAASQAQICAKDGAAFMDWGIKVAGAQPTHFPSSFTQDDSARNFNEGKRSFFGPLAIGQDQQLSDSTLIAAWALTVSLHSLAEDVVFGLLLKACAGRVLPVRVQIPEDNATASDFVASVRSGSEQIKRLQEGKEISYPIPHDSAPWGEARNLSSCLNISSHAHANGVANSTASHNQSSALFVTCNRLAGSTKISLEADATVHAPAISRSILAHFRSAIQALSSNHETLLRDVNLFDDQDFKHVESWTQAPEPIAAQPLLHKMVENQARSHPLAIAVGQTDQVMTYAELDKGASVLASYLSVIAIPEHRIGNVAIFFPKSPFAVLAMLAVLKAGRGEYLKFETNRASAATLN